MPLRATRLPRATESGILPKAIDDDEAYELDRSALASPPALSFDDDLMAIAGSDTALAVADGCRRAALMFVNGAANGWRKRDLAGWLLGPYREATRHSAWERIWPPTNVAPETTSAVRIHDLMELVRIGVASTLADAAQRRATFVTDAIRARAILPARSDAEILWIPVDAPRMGLEQRVLALFAVDYLARPDDYAKVIVCPECDYVSFDEIACDGCWGLEKSGVVTLSPDRVRTA